MIKIAVVNAPFFGMYTDAFERLKRIGEVRKISVPKGCRGRVLADLLRDYHFIIMGVVPIHYYDREFFEYNENVVMIARRGISYDNIDIKAAEEYGVIVVRVPPLVEREAVAEHTIALMLSALRQIPQSYNVVREGKWCEYPEIRTRFIGRELSSLVVGIVGLGNIGSRVAEILSKGFNTRVVVYDPYVPRDRIESLGYKYVKSLKELFSICDIVTLHAPLTEETRKMINREVIMSAKRGIMIINTARGELVDEDALIEAIEKGIVSAYATDVVEGEPISKDHRLLKYPNIIITPHIAFYTYEAQAHMDYAVVNAIENYLQNKPINGIVVLPKQPRKLRV